MMSSKQPKGIIKFNSKSPKLQMDHLQTNNTNMKQKKKLSVVLNKQKEKTIVKNLMQQFDQVRQLQKKRYQDVDNTVSQDQQEKQLSIQVQVVSKSTTNRQDLSTKALSDPYKIHLPQSYILAMSGLQQGIKSRQAEISKLKKKIKDQNNSYQEISQAKQASLKENKQLCLNIEEMKQQISFLKATVSDVRLQLTKQIKQRGVLQNQMKIYQKEANFSKNDYTVLISNYQNEINILKSQNEKLACQIQMRQKAIIQVNKDICLANGIVNNQNLRVKENIQPSDIQHNIEIEKRKLAEAKQRQRYALQQKQILDRIERQISRNRQVPKDVGSQQKILRDRSKTMTAEKIKQNYNDIVDKRKDQTSQQQTAIKHLRSSASRADRSSSTFKPREPQQKSNRRQLVSQMRQLLRHQKELVSFNYQIQLLEKQMSTKVESLRRQQLQKQYGRLRRQIQKKQLQIKEIKNFLDNPLQACK